MSNYDSADQNFVDENSAGQLFLLKIQLWWISVTCHVRVVMVIQLSWVLAQLFGSDELLGPVDNLLVETEHPTTKCSNKYSFPVLRHDKNRKSNKNRHMIATWDCNMNLCCNQIATKTIFAPPLITCFCFPGWSSRGGGLSVSPAQDGVLPDRNTWLKGKMFINQTWNLKNKSWKVHDSNLIYT